ncbi:sensor histidine kinase [Phytoactinopolyspora halotolerans]|uniref:histidine kinase n=1 Tax=Phytoactinopolyspora halotolerans TaxID=1981512 RepID=A0A6L9SH87_9ACTN|nr:sensor histidine kinase [Phytoactinopolyspora halotolerans]NEE03460.1 sensor histidine kinase [Phytoactinopolyspora halotolerans]
MASRGTAPALRSDAWWREGTVVAVAFVLCLLGGALHADDTLAAPPAPAYVIAAISSAMLPARHRAPVATMIATAMCGMLVAPLGLLPTPLIVAPAVISAYTLAGCTGGPVAVAVLLPSTALLVAFTPFFEAGFSWEDTSRLVTVAASPLVAAVFGRSARHRRAYLALVEERARRAEESRDSQARQKVAEERVRIARELHDLVAHQITLANAQASVAAHLFDTDPGQTRTNIEELVKTTRHALDELRATVGLLRQADDESASTDPAPGLSQLPALLSTFGRAGLDVSMFEDGAARALPPAVDLTAYRIIQEALTNVTKHAATSHAQVHVTWSREYVSITVSDDGGGPRTSPDRPAGYGLIGMRERAAAVGGTLTAGARAEGGFLVAAQLPLGASTSAAEADDEATHGGTTTRSTTARRPGPRPRTEYDAPGIAR